MSKVWFKSKDKTWSVGTIIGSRKFERVEQVFLGQIPRTWNEIKFLLSTDSKKVYEIWESETYEFIARPDSSSK